MNADLEIGLEPFGEFFDKLLAEVAPMPRPGFLKGMVQVLAWNLGDVDGVSTKVKEVMGNQCVSALLGDVVFCVDSVSDIALAILGERDDLIDPHGVDELAMPGALAEVDPTSSRNPIAFLGQFNDIASG